MCLIIHRGSHQIGDSVIEVSEGNTRILLDCGTNLPSLDAPPQEDGFELEGLTCGVPAFDAVFITHYHGDYCGLLQEILLEIPVYLPVCTYEVLRIIAEFTGGTTDSAEGNCANRRD